jgi:hypothetical protein
MEVIMTRIILIAMIVGGIAFVFLNARRTIKHVNRLRSDWKYREKWKNSKQNQVSNPFQEAVEQSFVHKLIVKIFSPIARFYDVFLVEPPVKKKKSR